MLPSPIYDEVGRKVKKGDTVTVFGATGAYFTGVMVIDKGEWAIQALPKVLIRNFDKMRFVIDEI